MSNALQQPNRLLKQLCEYLTVVGKTFRVNRGKVHLDEDDVTITFSDEGVTVDRRNKPRRLIPYAKYCIDRVVLMILPPSTTNTVIS